VLNQTQSDAAEHQKQLDDAQQAYDSWVGGIHGGGGGVNDEQRSSLLGAIQDAKTRLDKDNARIKKVQGNLAQYNKSLKTLNPLTGSK
jgi:peptidoglycan hydrolase CwlO-like protein